MAYKIINEAYCPYANAQLREFICDTDADVENLPKCCTGSKAVSVATGITHMVNASGYWVPLGGGIVGGSLEGDGQEFHQFAPTALAFRSTEPLEEFQEVKVNDETVDPENYDLEEGSTIVKFKPDYLKTLGNGNHKIAIVSKNNVVSGNFNVKVPELNEHGFYYNQAYTAWVDAFSGKTTFFFREDGTMDCLVEGEVTETATYTSGTNGVVVNSMMGTFNGTVSADGREIYCVELATNFVLGDTSIVADEDYIYIYKEELGGYEVMAIDKTKAEYGAIKTGINGLSTVALALKAFAHVDLTENSNLIFVPEIPDDITIIGQWAFMYCRNLKSITFANNSQLATIESGAFEDCKSLASIKFPASVITIGTNAFLRCANLKDITFEGTIAQWNAITKGYNWNKNVPATHVQCTDGTVEL